MILRIDDEDQLLKSLEDNEKHGLTGFNEDEWLEEVEGGSAVKIDVGEGITEFDDLTVFSSQWDYWDKMINFPMTTIMFSVLAD